MRVLSTAFPFALILSACGAQRAPVPTAGGGDAVVRTPTPGPGGVGPTPIPAAPLNIAVKSELSLGRAHGCIATGTKTHCWGSNLFGAAGGGDLLDRLLPAIVGSGLPTFVSLAAASFHSCAAADDGRVFCWGDGRWSRGAVGGPPALHTATAPIEVPGLRNATSVVAGERFSCALTGSGVLCWGARDELGAGLSGDLPEGPVEPSGLASGVGLLAAGVQQACAALDAGGITCWGNNAKGRLGISGNAARIERPTRVEGIAGRVQALALGDFFGCATLEGTGNTVCWGEVPGASAADAASPKLHEVSGPADVIQLAAGAGHACALERGGDVWCWGANPDGRLGHAQTDGSPRKVTGLPAKAVSIAAGGSSSEGRSCAKLSDGSLTCWGANKDAFRSGLLGLGADAGDLSSPTAVALP